MFYMTLSPLKGFFNAKMSLGKKYDESLVSFIEIMYFLHKKTKSYLKHINNYENLYQKI